MAHSVVRNLSSQRARDQPSESLIPKRMKTDKLLLTNVLQRKSPFPKGERHKSVIRDTYPKNTSMDSLNKHKKGHVSTKSFALRLPYEIPTLSQRSLKSQQKQKSIQNEPPLKNKVPQKQIQLSARKQTTPALVPLNKKKVLISSKLFLPNQSAKLKPKPTKPESLPIQLTYQSLSSKNLQKKIQRPLQPKISNNSKETSEIKLVAQNKISPSEVKIIVQNIAKSKNRTDQRIPLIGDNMSEMIFSAKSHSVIQDVLSNFSDFEVANEDWNELQINKANPVANGKLDNYNNDDILKKIAQLQKTTCRCGGICDTFCTKLGPKKQCRIIKSLMDNDHFQSGSTRSGFGAQGEKKYIINASWWCKWCDYVNFTQTTTMDKVSESVESSIIDKQTCTFYEKPGSIENQPLLDTNGKLLRSLVEHFDFVVVKSDVWQHLNSWYSSDHKICRRMVLDQIQHLKLDLYPDDISLGSLLRLNTQILTTRQQEPLFLQTTLKTIKSSRSSQSSGILSQDMNEGKQENIDTRR